MNKYFSERISSAFLVLIPIIFFWHPNWAGFLGIQPYWPLLWLLPWSMIYGSFNGCIFGLFLGLILDSVTLESSFTQIPGLILCGFLFGKIKIHRNVLVGHFRYGLICSFGSFLCGTSIFLQILVKNFSDINFLIFISNIQNILAEVFLTGFFAPFICSHLLRLFQFSSEKTTKIKFSNK